MDIEKVTTHKGGREVGEPSKFSLGSGNSSIY